MFPVLSDAAVSSLQAALRQLQVLQPTEPFTAGVYDAATRQAVLRFQWFVAHVPGALGSDGRHVSRKPARLPLDGVAGERTRRLAASLADQGLAATGLLRRVDFSRLPHTRPNAGFAALLDGTPAIGLCERDFVPVLAGMDARAQRLGLFLFVNELFRVDGNTACAVAAPSSFSPHRIGRAVDLQLGTEPVVRPGQNPRAAGWIRSAPPGSPAIRFRQHVRRALQCRWGGDFDPMDLPHFDRQVLPSGGTVWQMHYFFDQLQYRQALRNPAAIPETAFA